MAGISQQASLEVQAAFRQCSDGRIRDWRSLEEALVLVRTRLRSEHAHGTPQQQIDLMAHSLVPLWTWLMSETDIVLLDFQTLSELTWNVLVAALSRTQGADACPHVTQDVEVWNRIIQSLLAQRGASSAQVKAQQTGFHPKPLHLTVLGLFCFAIDGWIGSDRARFYIECFGVLCLTFAAWWWLRGSDDDSGNMTRPTNFPDRPVFLTLPDVQLPEPGEPGGGSFTGDIDDVGVPSGVPPIPGNSGQTLPELPAGTSVTLNSNYAVAALRGQVGSIVTSNGGLHEVTLTSGAILARVPRGALDVGVGVATDVFVEPGKQTGEFYAPYSGSGVPNKTQAQATRLKDALTKAHGLQATLASWAALFWQAVKNEKDLYGLEDPVRVALDAHGYLGDASVGPPRVDDLKKALGAIEVTGGPPHGSGGELLRADIQSGLSSDPERMAWHLHLPADLQRAAPELYRNIRSEGAASVRQWVNEQHPSLEQKQTAQYQVLFSAATIVDYEVAGCRTEDSLMHKLASSDTLEINLRKLGSFVYLRRTKDKAGANRMLGIRAPGTQTDIAPRWMVDDASAFSKVEYQRLERSQKVQRLEGGGGSSGSNQGGHAHSKGSKFRGRGRGGGGKGGAKGGGSSGTKTQG